MKRIQKKCQCHDMLKCIDKENQRRRVLCVLKTGEIFKVYIFFINDCFLYKNFSQFFKKVSCVVFYTMESTVA